MTIYLRKNTVGPVLILTTLCVCFILLSCLQAQSQNTQLIIKPGSMLVATDGKLVLKNTDITANGTLNAPGANVIFSGSAGCNVNGSQIPVIKVLTLNKTGGSKLTLNNNIKIHSLVDFQNGLIELNNNVLTLDAGAALQNESETSHITGTGGGSVTASKASVNNPNQLNVGALGVSITSAVNLGDVAVTRMHVPIVNPEHAGKKSIQRTFFIQPVNNAALNATLRFYYLEAELNGNNENTLTLWRSADGVSWISSGAGIRNTTDNYVEKSGIAKLSYWTLTDADNALPVTLLYFRAICQNKYALIEWKTGGETNMDHFEVERSSDAVQWVTLQNIPASNAATGASYSYKDNTPQSTAFYRLKVIDKLGTSSYSTVFTGGCADIAMPFLVYPNPAKSHATARISVRENTKASIQIFNIEGQRVYNSYWNLQPGNNQFNLPLTRLAPGSYVVKVLLNNAVLQAQLIKQ